MTDEASRIGEVFSKAGIDLDQTQILHLKAYYETLIETNQRMNLTAITEFNEVLEKHFLDSAYPLEVLGDSLNEMHKMIDVGTGAGFPGLVMKIVRPEFDLTLLDALQKRIDFLRDTAGSLKLSGVSFVHMRSEDASKPSSPMRSAFDLASARAVAHLNVLAEYCLPFVRVGGVFLAYKGPDCGAEIEESKNAVETLGGRIEQVYEYDLPGTDYRRTLILIRKEKETPRNYPRRSGKIEKSPL